MTTDPDPQDVFLAPPGARLLYCALCDEAVRAFCDDVVVCHAQRAVPPDRAARGVVVGVVGGAVLWALLLLGARLLGVL